MISVNLKYWPVTNWSEMGGNMKKNLNFLGKLLHYTENTTTGIVEHEHETNGDYIQLGETKFLKNRRQYKHFGVAENCTANKRKTKP